MRTSKAAQDAERTALLQRIDQIKAEGEVLEDCRLNFSAAGGTASRSAKLSPKYAQTAIGSWEAAEQWEEIAVCGAG